MMVSKGIGIGKLVSWTFVHIVGLLSLMGGVVALYHFEFIEFSIPIFALSVIGTAVAFYAGFKNNQTYVRMWEARKIWGGIVNDSRSWGIMVDGFVSNLFSDKKATDEEIKFIKKKYDNI